MTYEYLCTDCGHAWEAEQSISEPPLKTCPTCLKATAKRQVSGGAGFILKGGGWYADLYSSTKSNKKDEGGSETKKPSESKPTPGSGSSTPSGGDKGSSSSTGSSNSSSSSTGSSSTPSSTSKAAGASP